MSESTAQEIPVASDEPFMGPIDIVLILALLGGAAYWLFRNRKKEEPSSVKSYSIQ